MEQAQYARKMVDAAETAVFNLQQELLTDYPKSYFRKRKTLDDIMPIISDMHIRLRALSSEITDICDRLTPYDNGRMDGMGGGR